GAARPLGGALVWLGDHQPAAGAAALALVRPHPRRCGEGRRTMAHPFERHHGLGGRGAGGVRQVSRGDGGMKIRCAMALILSVVSPAAMAASPIACTALKSFKV